MTKLKVRKEYIDVSIGQLHIRLARPETDHGKPPLICFHMSPNSGSIYENFLSEIGQDRIAIAPDTPGFGYSDRTAQPPEINDYANIFLELLDKLGITGSIDVMGYHTGAMISLEIARIAPTRVRRVIPISAPIFSEADRDQHRDIYAHRMPTRDGSHLAEFWRETLHWYEQGNGGLAEVERYFPESLMGGSTAWWGHRAAFNFNVEDALKAITQPVLIINPHDDLEEYTLRAQPYLRNARIYNATAWGHCFLDTYKIDAAALVRSFLDAPADAPFGSVDFVPSAKANWDA